MPALRSVKEPERASSDGMVPCCLDVGRSTDFCLADSITAVFPGE
jgi:hypothetical protein